MAKTKLSVSAETLASPAPVVTANAGEQTVSMRLPADLAEWSLTQARREGTDRTKKIIGFLREWKLEVETTAQNEAEQRQAEIAAAVAAALAKQRRSKPAKKKRMR